MEDIGEEKTKKNIHYWENEAQKQLKKGDIMGAVGCKILADNLRKDLLGGKEEWYVNIVMKIMMVIINH